MIDFHTHLPALIEMVAKTRGPVLELGSGEGSTLVLHEICARMQRALVTLDSNQEWLSRYLGLGGDGHELTLVTDWDAHDFARPHLGAAFDVVLVDHAPGERRHLDVMRLRQRQIANIFVLHDAEPGSDYIYQYTKIAPAFLHRRTHIEPGGPHTLILSDRPLP